MKKYDTFKAKYWFQSDSIDCFQKYVLKIRRKNFPKLNTKSVAVAIFKTVG